MSRFRDFVETAKSVSVSSHRLVSTQNLRRGALVTNVSIIVVVRILNRRESDFELSYGNCWARTIILRNPVIILSAS